MKRIFSFLLIALIFAPASFSFADPAHIIIFRHGEKINDADPNLSPKGYKRAAALARYFSQKDFKDQYGIPGALYAASARVDKSERSVQTMQPTADALNIKLVDSYEKGDEKNLMKDILDDSSLDGKTVLICWSHAGIPKFLKPLDLDEKWPKGAFDRFWVLDRDSKGDWKFRDLPQQLLPGDSDK